MLKSLVRYLMRRAEKESPGDPIAWLEALSDEKFLSMNAQNGQITGTSVNGKSVYLAAMPGCSLKDIHTCAEYAILLIQSGHSGPPGKTQAVLN